MTFVHCFTPRLSFAQLPFSSQFLLRAAQTDKDTHMLNRCIWHTSASRSQPSLIPYLPPMAGQYLLPGLMYALVSDHEKYASVFTLWSLGLVHELSSIIAAMSLIPWGGIKRNEYKNPSLSILHAQKRMIYVLPRHGRSVRGIASLLLFSDTKSMTRMRFTYFSTQ